MKPAILFSIPSFSLFLDDVFSFRLFGTKNSNSMNSVISCMSCMNIHGMLYEACH